ncbi:DNA-binding Lrp family transcriptional regulator [Agromyces albus]|nr:DNA-binding Lrp family transcriptional regulator [Agromyces albus]
MSVLSCGNMSDYDAVDRALLAALSADPRATVVALADRLGLSRNTVQARMSRLEASGAFLSFERSIDPAPLGFPLEAFISVHVRQKRLREVVDDIARIPEVIQAHGLSGSIDLLVRVICRDAHDLFRIDGEILAIDGVERTETSLAMGELIPYRLGPLLEREV